MNRKHLLFGLVIILCSFRKYASHSFHSANFNIENIKPFTIGEKLVYKIAYGIIEAGNANLEVKSIASNPECFRVVAKGYTNFAFDWSFKVNTNTTFLHPLLWILFVLNRPLGKFVCKFIFAD